jgi:hypothetical protein
MNRLIIPTSNSPQILVVLRGDENSDQASTSDNHIHHGCIYQGYYGVA